MSNFIFTAFITHRKMVQFFILLSSLVAFLEVITTMSQLEPLLRVNPYPHRVCAPFPYNSKKGNQKKPASP